MLAKNDLTRGSVNRHLFSLSAPMVLGIFSLMAFNLIDTFFVARLGTAPLAAISFTFPIVLLIGGIAMGLGTAVASLVARAIGENKIDKAKDFVTSGLILSFLIVAFFSFLGLLSIDFVFSLLGARGVVLDLVAQYMRVWYIGVFFLVVPMVGNDAIRAGGDARLPAIIMMLSAAVNLVLDPLLIFGLWGFPRWELHGAALATVIARAFSLCLSLFILCVKKKMVDFSRLSLKSLIIAWRDILYIGVPSALTNMLIPLSTAVFTRLAAGFGWAAIAAVGVGLRLESFAVIVVMAISSALVPLVGQNCGAGHAQRVSQARLSASKFVVIWGSFCVLLFFISAPFLAKLFSRDAEVIGHLTRYLWIVPLSYGFKGLRMLHVSFFNALHKPLNGVFINIVWMFGLYLPFAWLGSRFFGLYGLFAAVMLAHGIAGVLAFAWGSKVRVENFCLRR